MTEESPKSKRPIFKIVGIAILVIGIGVIALALASESSTVDFVIPGEPVELSRVVLQSDFQRYGIGFFGLVIIYLGFRVFRYIPVAERERDWVSEEDLDE